MPSSPPIQGDQQQRMQKTRKLLNAYQIERQQLREQKAKQKEQAEKRKRNCIQARDNLRKYTDYGNVYRLDEDGKREYLSEKERAALLQRSREAVARLCNKP
jgi:cell division protein FtsN